MDMRMVTVHHRVDGGREGRRGELGSYEEKRMWSWLMSVGVYVSRKSGLTDSTLLLCSFVSRFGASNEEDNTNVTINGRCV